MSIATKTVYYLSRRYNFVVEFLLQKSSMYSFGNNENQKLYFCNTFEI